MEYGERREVVPESSPTQRKPSRRVPTGLRGAGRIPSLCSALRPYVDLVNLLLTCGEEVKEAVTRSVQAQCEQNWGGLCSILSFCTSALQRPPTAPPERHLQADRAKPSGAHPGDSEPSSRETAGRGAKGERGSKSPPDAHARGRAAAHGAQGTSGSSEWEDEQAEYSDIRR